MLDLSLNWARENEIIHAVGTPLFGHFLWRKGHSLSFLLCKRHCVNWTYPKGQNINEKYYVKLRKQLIKVIKSKITGKLMKSILTHTPSTKILCYSVLITALNFMDIPSNSLEKIDDTRPLVFVKNIYNLTLLPFYLNSYPIHPIRIKWKLCQKIEAVKSYFS